MKDKKLYAGWQRPVPFDTTNRPVFPIDCLPPSVRKYALAVAEATQTPVDMAAVAALAVTSACVQGKYEVEPKADWREPLNLYFIIVANPAERKSAIISLLTHPLNQYEKEWNENHNADIERNKVEKRALEKAVERLTELVSRSGDTKDLATLMQKRDELTNFKEITPLRLLADDTTPEALITLLATYNGKMAVISSEGGIFEILRGRYSQSINIDVFLKAHIGDVLKIDRKGREYESIEKPCLTVLLSVQPQVLESLVANNIFRGRGLTARFLYSIPVSKMGHREYETQPISVKCASDYKRLCYDLLNIPSKNTPEILRLSTGATLLSVNFAEAFEPRLISDLEDIADFAGKLHGAIIRIAGILHLIDGNRAEKRISVEIMRSAIKIGEYFLEHARAAYQLGGSHKQPQNAKYILRQIKKQGKMELSRYEIFRLCRGRFRHDEDMTPAFEMLIEYGYIRETETDYKGSGRKPSQRYLINPYFMD